MADFKESDMKSQVDAPLGKRVTCSCMQGVGPVQDIEDLATGI